MDVHISSIGTAVPDHKFKQQEILDFMVEAHDLQGRDATRLKALYRASGINYRHSVIPDYGSNDRSSFAFYPSSSDLEPFPPTSLRMAWYKKHALPLSIKAINDCLTPSMGVKASDISHLITISCTGFYAPGLDIELVEKLGMNSSVERTSVQFMGCYAAFNGLKLARQICRAEPQAKVLVVCTELCTLHFQKKNHPDNFLANALFADGSAAALIQAEEEKGLRMEAFYSDLYSQGKQDMAWNVGDHGFHMRLSEYVPELIREGIGKLTRRLLERASVEMSDVDALAVHPGGKSILHAVEKALRIGREKNTYAHQVLAEYGNMSSATVLFVLKKLMEDRRTNPSTILSFAFGPGLTLESGLFTALPSGESKFTLQTSLADEQPV
ncbi:type III polyketide synthase [Roseivirga sp. BDSF3-8]|uniref:type III polyketide synthase n=1 Tax=Roseivirga sp. BDSF3-8 TaxID=3241598 RepID=UPI003531E018